MVGSQFRAAVEKGDVDAAIALLAPDVTFRSPVVYKPYEGREAVAVLLRAIFVVLEDFRYVDELAGEGTQALIFQARIADREVEGLDHLVVGDDGLISEFRVMIRPLSGLNAAAQAMGAQLAGTS